MSPKFNFSVLGLFLSVLLGCQSTPCRVLEDQENRAQKNTATGAVGTDEAPKPNYEGANVLKVRVYKPDGSLQCGMGKRISLDTMEKELAGIKVFTRSNRNDGLMRIQVCGAPTGNANVYEIRREDLSKALEKGFKEWTFD